MGIGEGVIFDTQESKKKSQKTFQKSWSESGFLSKQIVRADNWISTFQNFFKLFFKNGCQNAKILGYVIERTFSALHKNLRKVGNQ